jgi:hypothetical protein
MASPTRLLFRFDLGDLTFRRIATFHSVAAELLEEAADGVSRDQTALMEFPSLTGRRGVSAVAGFPGETPLSSMPPTLPPAAGRESNPGVGASAPPGRL